MTPMLARKRLKGPGGIHLPRNRSARGITRHRRINHPGNRKEEGTNNVEEDDGSRCNGRSFHGRTGSSTGCLSGG